jgi:hypothetical protein
MLQHIAFAGTLLGSYWRHFPITLMPNKVTSAMRALLHLPTGFDSPCETETPHLLGESVMFGCEKESRIPPLLEELAADVFGGAFSPKYNTVARIAAGRIANTTYSRYYQLHSLFSAISNDTLSLNAAVHLLRRDYYGHTSTLGSVSSNGMLIEAAQILTTHNLIIFGDARIDASLLMEVLERSWVLLERLSTKSVEGLAFARKSQHQRQIAHGFRQFVFFLSKLTVDDQLVFVDKHMQAFSRRCVGECGREFCQNIAAVRCAAAGDMHGTETIVLGWRKIE